MNNRLRMTERRKKEKRRYTSYRPCQVLSSPPGNRTGQIYRWNIKTNPPKSTQNGTKNKKKVINKRCIYMQMFKDYLCTKRNTLPTQKQNNTLTYIIAWHSIMAKSCFSSFFFKNYILKSIFLIINPYQLCFGKWVLLKCDDGLVTLGDAPTLQHNSEAWHNSHLLLLFKGQNDSFFSIHSRTNFFLFIQSQAVTLTGSFKLRSSRPTADQRSVKGIVSCFYFVKKIPKT